MQFPENNHFWKGQREKLLPNFKSICYSLPSFTFIFFVIVFIETEELINLIFDFVSILAI